MPGTPARGTAITETWSTPVVVGHYGIAGADGTDGNGVEYIFTAYSAALLPSSRYPDNAWGFDQPGTRGGQRWEDGAPDLKASTPYLFRSERGVPGTPARGTAIIDTWSTPVVVGRFGEEGQDGEDGNGVEYIFTLHSSAALPSNRLPNNAWGYDRPGTTSANRWYDGAPQLTEANPFLFRSERAVPGVPADGDPVAAPWSTPVVVGHYGRDGEDGEDAVGAEPVVGASYFSSTARSFGSSFSARATLADLTVSNLPSGGIAIINFYFEFTASRYVSNTRVWLRLEVDGAAFLSTPLKIDSSMVAIDSAISSSSGEGLGSGLARAFIGTDTTKRFVLTGHADSSAINISARDVTMTILGVP